MTKILIIEDDEMLREVYHTILTSAGYDPDLADDGQIGLQYCKDTHYDLILLDLMMPEVDGVGFLQHADLRHTSPTTTVIVLSNLSSGDDVEAALRLGARKHLLKSSLTPKDLLAVIQQYIGPATNQT